MITIWLCSYAICVCLIEAQNGELQQNFVAIPFPVKVLLHNQPQAEKYERPSWHQSHFDRNHDPYVMNFGWENHG